LPGKRHNHTTGQASNSKSNSSSSNKKEKRSKVDSGSTFQNPPVPLPFRARYYYYKAHAPAEFANRTVMDSGAHMGTCHGLAMLPYIRDTRRSIGLDGFLLNVTALNGVRFHDTVGLALHGVDIWGHRLMPYTNLYPSCPSHGEEEEKRRRKRKKKGKVERKWRTRRGRS
jgi:hypothetical protein